jgi:hypothetical protein
MNVRIPRALATRVKMHAVVTQRPMQEIVAEILDKAIPAYKPQPKGK